MYWIGIIIYLGVHKWHLNRQKPKKINKYVCKLDIFI